MIFLLSRRASLQASREKWLLGARVEKADVNATFDVETLVAGREGEASESEVRWRGSASDQVAIIELDSGSRGAWVGKESVRFSFLVGLVVCSAVVDL